MSPLEVLAAELGIAARQIDEKTRLRLDAALADLRRSAAEWELRFERLERAVADRLAALKDGDSVTVADVAPVIEEAVAARIEEAAERIRADAMSEIDTRIAAIPPAEKGDDADPKVVAEHLREALTPVVEALIAEKVAAIPVPKDGPTIEEIQPLVDEAVAKSVSAIPPAAPGKDADMDQVRQFIREEVANIPIPKDGETPSPEQIRDIAAPIIAEAVAALPPAQPGKDADLADIQRMVDEAVSRIAPPKDGVTPSPEEVRAIVEDVVSQWPKPKDGEAGKDADPEVIREMVREAVDAIEKPKDGKDGRLPVVKVWEDRVYYAGDVCSFDGSTWQASVDTGRQPPHADWTCLAARGEKGVDADQIKLCGAFDQGEEYRRLSIVMLGGASFIANRDNPGECPGEGWNLLAKQGKKGDPGPVSKGPPGRGIAHVSLDDAQGILTLHMNDGTSEPIDLYPLLSRLG